MLSDYHCSVVLFLIHTQVTTILNYITVTVEHVLTLFAFSVVVHALIF